MDNTRPSNRPLTLQLCAVISAKAHLYRLQVHYIRALSGCNGGAGLRIGWEDFMNTFKILTLSLWSPCRLEIYSIGYLKDGALSGEKFTLIKWDWFERIPAELGRLKVLTLQIGSVKTLRADGLGHEFRLRYGNGYLHLRQNRQWQLRSQICVFLLMRLMLFAWAIGAIFFEMDWKSLLCLLLCFKTCKLCSD